MSFFRVTLYIPPQHSQSPSIIAATLAGMSDLAGGATRTDSIGAYTMADGTLCVEPIAQIATIVGEETLAAVKTFALMQAQHMKETLPQESVLITIDHVPEFILV